MKKAIFIIIFFQSIIYSIYASGSADMQSQALLYRQKRTTWESAPDSAVFYECYLVKQDNEIYLLDALLVNNISISPFLLINEQGSMKIQAHNESAMIRQNDTIYKCVVLESGALMGMAIVNIFSVEIVNMKIGYLMPYYYASSLIDFSENNNDNRGVVFFPNDPTVIIINRWPNPSNFNNVNVYTLLTENYNRYLNENPNISREIIRQDYNNKRRGIEILLTEIENGFYSRVPSSHGVEEEGRGIR